MLEGDEMEVGGREEWDEDGSGLSLVPGSLVFIWLRNFMTYSDVKLAPGPHLNLILGPNGSGKSSVVCAICIGLGGSPKLLGRADRVSEFVKRGEEQGSTEIVLAGARRGQRYRVRRTIKRDNTSKWELDGRPSSEKKVKELVKELGVQVDSLCQFLPQDRVSSFAHLGPRELLVETERAAGGDGMHEAHEQLIKMGEEMAVVERSLGGHTRNVAALERQLADLEKDLEKIKARERLQEELAWVEAKKPWLAYEASKLAFAACVDKKKAAEEVLKPYSLVKKGAYEEGAKLKPASNWTFLASYRP